MKIAILSDSVTFPTGYRNQAMQLALYLHRKGHEIHYLCNGMQGMGLQKAILEDGTEIPFRLHSMGKANYFQDNMSQILKDLQIDFYIILLDTFMLWGNDGWFMKIDTSPAQTSFWFPSDGGGGMPKMCENILRKVEHPVAMSKFAQKQVNDYYGIKTNYIPHGTDIKKFHRLPDNEREMIKAKYGLAGKFVIGTVMRNQPRKFPDRYIKTILSLAKKLQGTSMKDWAVLMHTDFTDVSAPIDLQSMIRRYNLENKVFGTGLSALKGFPESQMNEIYNCFDVFFLSTSGEGFGIPIIEAMACEVPCVVTDYTTTEELITQNQAGFGARLTGVPETSFFDKNAKDYDEQVIDGTITGNWEVERGFIDVNDAADKIIQLYQSPSLCRLFGKNGRKSVEEKYDFEIVGKMWEDLINKSVQDTK